MDFTIARLGACTIDAPPTNAFVDEGAAILYDITRASLESEAPPVFMELAGPRRRIFFQPEETTAAIVTCGGLCPGLNDVIRGLVMVLWYHYGVTEVLGIRYGYEGLAPICGHQPMALTPDVVEDIHEHGGTILGSSRGPQPPEVMVDFLVDRGIDILFTVGGDGTQRGALDIADEVARRGLDIAVVGVPKTIDNDIALVDRTFGFETAVAMSQAPIQAAHMEAKGRYNGVGLVKLMGRESGYIAAYASLASSDVNLVLIPEAPFTVERVCQYLERRLAEKAHAVVVVAEGAGADLVPGAGKDASGNTTLGDVGVFLKGAIADHFRSRSIDIGVKYIDPSYTIRSAPASADDSVFCFQLAQHAVHAAMTGRTAMVVGTRNGSFIHVPIAIATERRKQIDPKGLLWHSILDNTGQPRELA